SIVSSAALHRAGAAAPLFVTSGAYRVLSAILMACAALKLLFEASVFRHLADRQHTLGKRLALLMRGDLGRVTAVRFLCGALAGLVLPGSGLALVGAARDGGGPFPFAQLAVLAIATQLAALAGEILERYLFFAAAPASKMPGGIA